MTVRTFKPIAGTMEEVADGSGAYVALEDYKRLQAIAKMDEESIAAFKKVAEAWRERYMEISRRNARQSR